MTCISAFYIKNIPVCVTWAYCAVYYFHMKHVMLLAISATLWCPGASFSLRVWLMLYFSTCRQLTWECVLVYTECYGRSTVSPAVTYLMCVFSMVHQYTLNCGYSAVNAWSVFISSAIIRFLNLKHLFKHFFDLLSPGFSRGLCLMLGLILCLLVWPVLITCLMLNLFSGRG